VAFSKRRLGLKLRYDEPLSNLAFTSNERPYSVATAVSDLVDTVGNINDVLVKAANNTELKAGPNQTFL